MLKTKDGSLIKTHQYTSFPKARFTPGEVKLDGKVLPVRVTCIDHAKFPTYTYWQDGDKVFYAKGDLRDHVLTTVVPDKPIEE